MKSNCKYLYMFVALIAVAVTGCREDSIGGLAVDGEPVNSGSVVTFTTARADGIVSLSLDAPEIVRAGVWIDLDGNGLRAEDGSENVTVFNAFENYTLAANLKTVSVHGDLTYFGGASNEITVIDVSGSPYLTTLNVPMNRLAALDVSKNTLLARLDCSGNGMRSLDVSSNPALKSLWCFNNELTALDVSGNANLAFLDCSGNTLSALDVSRNAQLARLLAYNNQLASIDISQNGWLNRLWLFGNPFSDDEVRRIASLLKEAAGGDAWISDAPLDAALAEAVAKKGWTLNH